MFFRVSKPPSGAGIWFPIEALEPVSLHLSPIQNNKGIVRRVDGMAPADKVGKAIDAILDG